MATEPLQSSLSIIQHRISPSRQPSLLLSLLEVVFSNTEKIMRNYKHTPLCGFRLMLQSRPNTMLLVYYAFRQSLRNNSLPVSSLLYPYHHFAAFIRLIFGSSNTRDRAIIAHSNKAMVFTTTTIENGPCPSIADSAVQLTAFTIHSK